MGVDNIAIVAFLEVFLKVLGIVLVVLLCFIAFSALRPKKRQEAYWKTAGWRNRLSNGPRPRYGEFWQKMKRVNIKKRHAEYWKKRYPDDKPQSFYSDRR